MTRAMIAALLAVLLAAPAAAVAAPYSPHVALALPTAAGPATPAAVSATITQAQGEEPTRTIEARLPGSFGFNNGFTVVGCKAAEEQTGVCPESSRIGSIEADSPFGRAAGGLYITEDFRLLGLLIADLLVPLKVTGVLLVEAGQQITARFDDLPQLPSTRMSVAFDGGDRTPLALPRDCGTHVIQVRLVSASGVVRESDHPVTVKGCRAIPALSSARVDRARVQLGAPVTLSWRPGRAAVRTDVTLRRLRGGLWHELGSVRVPARTGTNRLRVGPRWRGRTLAGGHYRLATVAVDAHGTRSLTRTVDFRVR